MDAETLPFPSYDDLVLVAVVPQPRDLEIARLLGWYRIPLRHAPKILAVDYLAFYQPGSFNQRGRQIEFAAPVRGFELTTRGQLLHDEPDHPRAEEEYFKIQVGGLVALPFPIRAHRWRRLSFLYTTGAYLLTAETLNDLVLAGPERRLLWRSMRERALRNERYQPESLPELEVPDEILDELLGIIPFSASEAGTSLYS